MKRKISQQGRSTHSVSLPSSWVRKYNLSKGDEIDMRVEDNEIIVSTQTDVEIESRFIDVSALDSIATKVVCEMYKSGYDEIKIGFDGKEQGQAIRDVIYERFIGCEIVRETDAAITVRKVSEIKHEEFDAMLKRAFQVLLTFSQDVYDAFENSDFTELQGLQDTDKQVNKLTDFCKRALNKRDMTQYRKSKPLYYVVTELERLGDCYKDLCIQLVENKIGSKRYCLQMLGEINQYFKDFYDMFYRFDLNKAQNYYSKKDRIIPMLDEACLGASNNDLKVIKLYYRMFNILIGMNGSVMLMHL